MANIIRLGGGGSGGSATLITKSITQNGTYLATDDNADGYSEVNVNVAGGSTSKQVSYLKWKITKLRSVPASNAIQMAEFYLYQGDNLYNWNANASVTADLQPVSQSETPDRLIDGTDYKYCSTQWGHSQTGECNIVISLGETITIDENTSYAYKTADDENSRDPIAWTLYGSSDGTNWEELDIVDNEIPTSRLAATPKFVIPIGGGSIEYKNYLKFNGEGIILPWTINSDYKVEVTFYDTTYYNDRAVIGNDNSTSYFHLTEFSNKYFYQTSYNSESSFGPWSAGEHTIIYNDEDGKISFDGTVVGNSNIPDNNSVHYQIGGRGSRTAVQAYYGYIKDCKIYSKSTGTLLYHLRPAEVLGLSCLYEEVTGKLFSNATVEVVDTIT